MNKILILPMFFLTMCGTAPVTPPAGACSLPLDGSPAKCPTTWPDKDIKLPKQEVKGEVDIYNPYHWHTLHGVFVENLRRKRIEENMTCLLYTSDAADDLRCVYLGGRRIN